MEAFIALYRNGEDRIRPRIVLVKHKSDAMTKAKKNGEVLGLHPYNGHHFRILLLLMSGNGSTHPELSLLNEEVERLAAVIYKLAKESNHAQSPHLDSSIS